MREFYRFLGWTGVAVLYIILLVIDMLRKEVGR